MKYLYILLMLCNCVFAQDYVKIKNLPVEKPLSIKNDWLINANQYKASLYKSEDEKNIIISNGLLKRVFRISPNLTTIALDNLYSGEKFLRSVRAEASMKINGIEYEIGGLKGQPNQAFLTEEWIDKMKNDPFSMQFIGLQVSEIDKRLEWKKVRHSAPETSWPPKGIHVRMDYKMPIASYQELLKDAIQDSEVGRATVFNDRLDSISSQWFVHTSSSNPRSSFSNEGKAGEIYTPQNTAVFAERTLPQGTKVVETTLSVGTDLSRFYGPGIAMVWKNKVIKLHLSPGGDGYNEFMCIAGFDGKTALRRLKNSGKFDSSKE